MPAARLSLVPPPQTDEQRLASLLAEQAAQETALAETKAATAELARQWGYDNGYRTRISPEQMGRALLAKALREELG